MKPFKVGDRVSDESSNRGTLTYVYKDGKTGVVVYDYDPQEEWFVDLNMVVRLVSKKKSVLRYKYMLLNLGDVPMETPGYYKDEQEVKAQYRTADKVERLTDTVRKFRE